jgi:sec-independent protein translocase protein TatA
MFGGEFSIWHWIVLLIVVMLVFGTKKLRNVGGDLGLALRDFKRALKDDDTTTSAQATTTSASTTTVEPQKIATAKEESKV